MESVPVSGGGGSIASPAPFLLKTYEMVDDSSTDEIVSWSSNNNSFVVWNPQEFARLLLPCYFKHNNFSSFIRQLNTYGFRKSDPEKWEFTNEEFIKNQKHLLKNIHRRKPVHSHSHPQINFPDPEKVAFDEEIERLSREKISLETNLLNHKRQNSVAKLRLDTITHQIHSIEHRQDTMLLFLEQNVESHSFITHLSRKMESLDFSAFNKKRRLPQISQLSQISQVSQIPQIDHNTSLDDEQSTSRPAFHQDFSSKLTLDLTTPISDIIFPSHTTRSSSKDAHTPEALELSDTGTSLKYGIDAPVNEESDDHVSCQLNLTLASSSRLPQVADSGKRVSSSDDNANQKGVSRVNDVFWEQFLTERPGSSDAEQASSKFSVNSYDKKPGFGISGNTKNMEQLTL